MYILGGHNFQSIAPAQGCILCLLNLPSYLRLTQSMMLPYCVVVVFSYLHLLQDSVFSRAKARVYSYVLSKIHWEDELEGGSD